MRASSDLKTMLASIHRKSYPAYKDLRGVYAFGDYTLSIDHVQGDPFAAPSSLSIRIPLLTAGFPSQYYKEKHTRIALQDYLNRQFEQQVYHFSFKAKGSGKSGLISVSRCGQEILDRTACEITDRDLTARFTVGFPANGRTINAPELEKILFEFLPVCVRKSFLYKNQNAKAVENVFFLAEDQQFIREELKNRNLAAFVADGAILPRQSGVSDKPLSDCVPFSSPESMRTELHLPHKGKITGMGIPVGITLIVGGGYHGKSTLLNALESGVYNHIAGDGREYVIADDTAVKLRSEDGRFVKDVDISMFINDLPNKKDTHCFSTPDASGSTSQAAAIVESMEAGSHLFFIDEDTSATNFMVRDTFMQHVISRHKEPITPFLERARDLYTKAGISTILVAGSSGAFFHIADTIIQMDCYRPVDITESVKKLCKDFPLPPADTPAFVLPESRRIMTTPDFRDSSPRHRGRGPKDSGNDAREERSLKTKTHDRYTFSIGKESVDLRYVEQLTDYEQTAALAAILRYACENLIDGKRTLDQIVRLLLHHLETKGLSSVCGTSYTPCGLAMPRAQEIYACFNRFRRQ
ncbi:ABC-ATPase domain-containing protein [Blautia marasmi]|uniref:ABC-ATPase domain-containing protein n=1 Tax=Blautia marasmi TaxID=1917868 RepID=UPI000CF1D82A|nr:ABC-ATPase domain-containing protein [Blautia marasmi]